MSGSSGRPRRAWGYAGAVPVGSAVTATVEITRMVPEKGLVYLDSGCRVGDEPVVIGRTLVMVPSLAERAASDTFTGTP